MNLSQGIVYGIFVWLGVGNLFPWNIFITANKYYAMRFCGTYYEDNFVVYFSNTFTILQITGIIFAVKYEDYIPLNMRVLVPLIIYTILFFFTSVYVLFEINPHVFMGLTLLSTSLSGFCQSLLGSGLFGISGMLPSVFTSAIMSGQALAGVTVCLLNILSLLSVPQVNHCINEDENYAVKPKSVYDDSQSQSCHFFVDRSALGYFITAFTVLLCSISLFRHLLLQPEITCAISKNCFPSTSGPTKLLTVADDDEDPTDTPQATLGGHVQTSTASFMTLPDDEKEGGYNNHEYDLKSSIQEISSSTDLYQARDRLTKNSMASLTASESESASSKVFSMIEQIGIPAISVWLTFFITIGIFPALVVHIQSQYKCIKDDRFHNDLFIPSLFLVFNVFDFIGRILTAILPPLWDSQNIWTGALSRLLLIPLFICCDIENTQWVVLFANDFWPIFFIAVLGLSNGYLVNLSMILGPASVAPEDAALAGTIMLVFLTLGVVSGSMISFLVISLSTGKF